MTALAAPSCGCVRARHRHGTHMMYTRHACRCFACRIAESTAQATGRYGTGEFVLRVGTRRRLEALLALGWTSGQIGARVGVSKQAVEQWRTHDGPVLRVTAERVAAVYDDLSMVTPTGGYSQRTRRWALGQGFVPPLAWDDDTIDDPAARPCGVSRAVRGPQRHREFDRLTAAGVNPATARVLAARVGRRARAAYRAQERAA